MKTEYPTCFLCGREIIDKPEYSISLGLFYTNCCCYCHAVTDLANGFSEPMAEQVIFDIWDNPDAFRCPEMVALFRIIHADTTKSEGTTIKQFEMAKKYIISHMKDPRFAEKIADRYLEVYVQDEYEVYVQEEYEDEDE